MTTQLDLDSLHHLLDRVQDGVVSRRQVLALGGTDNDIERMVRRRELTVVLPGVYVDHTGRLNRAQREWVAVLAYWPAALTLDSALPHPRVAAVQIAVGGHRHPSTPDWIIIDRTAGLDARVNWRGTPPKVLLEHATIDVMSRRVAKGDVAAAFTVLADVCQTRRTTASRIAETLASRGRVAGRPLIAGMLSDFATGASSVLERAYLRDVERAHGLPRPTRQRASRAGGKRSDQDVRYEAYDVVVELDGRAFHDTASARNADARRDLAELAVAGAVTARVTYGLVFGEPCWTAAMVGRILRANGWTGSFLRCPRCPHDLAMP